MRFEGKVAIITGAGQGIGKEIGKKLIQEGCTVILNDIDKEILDKAVSELGSNAIACTGDSCDLNTINKLINLATEQFGRLDIVVANAGITLFGEFLDYPIESFQRLIDVNLKGTFYLTQAAARKMKESKNGGSILLMSSVTGHSAHKNLVAYGMTKAALEMLAKGLVVELSEFNININCVAPGATITERTITDPEYINTWSRITPTKRPCTVEDIANAVLFLVSEEAKQITGQSLIIDGGWTSMSPDPY